MARELYIPVNGFSKKTSKFYAPVNGFSKEIVKAYCSVNGFSKLFYEKGSGGGTGFWFFFETLRNKEFIEFIPDTYSIYTANTGIVFFAMIVAENTSEEALVPLLISTDRDAVTIQSSTGGYYTAVGSVTVNGDTWYWNAWQVFVRKRIYQYSPNCLLKNKVYSWQDSQVVTDLLDRIYADDFAENYRIQTKYTAVWTDREKTIRKALAIWLYKNYSFKGYNAYDTLLANIDNIVDGLLSKIQNDDIIQVYFGRVTMSPNRTQIAIFIDSVDSSIYQPPFEIRPTRKSQAGGYTYFMGSGSGYLQTTRTTYAYIEETNIRYISDSGRGYISTIGAIITAPSQYRIDYGVTLSNLGLNL